MNDYSVIFEASDRSWTESPLVSLPPGVLVNIPNPKLNRLADVAYDWIRFERMRWVIFKLPTLPFSPQPPESSDPTDTLTPESSLPL